MDARASVRTYRHNARRLWSCVVVLSFLAAVFLGTAARAVVREGWAEACIDGQQTYPGSGVGTVAYCAGFFSSIPYAPDASACVAYQASDYPGQSFSCEPGLMLWSPVTVATLPTGAPDPEEEPTPTLSPSDALAASWAVVAAWAAVFGIRFIARGLHGGGD